MSRKSRIDRRQFLASGVTLAGATLVGTSSLACYTDRSLAPAARDLKALMERTADGDLSDPSIIPSIGGVLSATITCTTNPHTIGGRAALQPVLYNGSYPAPTLWVKPGDMIDLTFTNKIVFDQADSKPGYGRPPRPSNMTNLHYHGMHVSPIGTADNMLVMVPANGTWRYQFRVPANHPAGLFWYHAHVHGLVTNHVGRGAAGMIYVAGSHTDRVVALGIRQRLMLLQQAYFQPDLRTLIFDDGARDDPNLALSLVNGELMPDIRMRPDEPQVWSLLNGSSSAFYLLRLEGHTFTVIAEDGIPLQSPRVREQTLLLPSAKRLEVVVRASKSAGRYLLSYDSYNQGVDTWPQKSVGTVIVSGEPWTGADHPGVDTSTPPTDLSKGRVSSGLQRRIVLGVDRSVPEGEFGRFTLNGHAWDPSYSEWTSTLNTVEEWLFVNETEQDHPMHVHTNPVQVTRINNAPVKFDGYQDTFVVPRFGSLTARTRFTDFTGGPILMHCHILDHEDMGMMLRFEISAA